MRDSIIEIDLPHMVTIGVVGDTHIPDRVNSLHPDLLPGLVARRVDLILHTGDICKEQVLEELRQIAPVYAVRGNRDWFLPQSVQMTETLIVNGVRILLTHGHVNSWHYWMDKAAYLVKGYQPERYVQRLGRIDPAADMIVFGHSHRAEQSTKDGILYFNPGSSCSGDLTSSKLSYGIIEIHPGGKVEHEIIPLWGYRINSGIWNPAKSPNQF